MKIVLFEYITGGGLCNNNLSALVREGELMVTALGRGLGAMDDVDLLTFRDARLPPPAFETDVAVVCAGDDWGARLDDALDAADAFWPLAPEKNGVLADLCLRAERRPCLLLNSPADVVDATAGKHRTVQRLREHGVPCVETLHLADCTFPQARDWVVKPDDGVGCESTRLLRAGATPDDMPSDACLCQPYVEGICASLSVIFSPVSRPCVLGVNRQQVVVEEGRFALRACHVNALAREAFDYDALAASVQAAFPGLVAYAGIDFIINGGGPQVLEINPRVTSSFAGLAASIGCNPCTEVLRAVRGEPLRCPRPENFSTVEVRCDGKN